jgi:hypothetical protein
MSAHDAIADMPLFNIEFWPLQAILMILCSFFAQNLQIRCLQKRIDEPLLSSYNSRFQKLSELYTILCFS